MKVSSVAVGVPLALALLLTSCGRGGEETEKTETDVFHADNDIAMTLKSIVDAVRVGEPFDSTVYNFEGILTDGVGAPLYTDISGSPGQWKVEVISKSLIRIHNLYLGDLLPGNLEDYLVSEIGLTDNDKVQTDIFDYDSESDISIYTLAGGEMRFETRSAVAPNGLEGPLVNIAIFNHNLKTNNDVRSKRGSAIN